MYGVSSTVSCAALCASVMFLYWYPFFSFFVWLSQYITWYDVSLSVSSLLLFIFLVSLVCSLFPFLGVVCFVGPCLYGCSLYGSSLYGSFL